MKNTDNENKNRPRRLEYWEQAKQLEQWLWELEQFDELPKAERDRRLANLPANRKKNQ